MSHKSNDDESEEKAEAATLIRQLREECAQIYELSVEESDLIQQLCEMMSEVQSFFKIGVALTPSLFASKEEIESVVLSMSSDIVIMKKGLIESHPLSKYDSPTVMAVLREAAVKITEHSKKYREDTAGRIKLMEKLSRELKKLNDLNKLREEDAASDQYFMPEISSEDLEPTA